MARQRSHVLALDQGTTGSTALVFDRKGAVRGRGYSEFTQHFPEPGWVEHDAQEIWEVTKRVGRQALRQARVEARHVAALGITNQRETVVAWDAKTGDPLANAIVWQDRRTAGLCRTLKDEGHEAMVRRRTGLLLDPYFSGTKIRWMLENSPKIGRARQAGRLRFGTIDAWLTHRLTGGKQVGTDVSNASRTLLFDLKKADWDDELLDLFGVERQELPPVVDSSGVMGETDEAVFGAAIPVAGLAGDQQAALFGQACTRPGMTKNTYGTGCFALINTGSKPPKPGKGVLATAAWRRNGRITYALEGSVFIAGAAVQWLRDGLRIIKKASETQALAESVPDTGDVFLVPAFVGLGAPHWDPYARGTVVGITRGTTRAHVVRAALEAIAFQSADVLDALAASSGRRLRRLRADGGATANGFLMQFQADILGLPVEVPQVNETTAQGAAFLAGRGIGLWTSDKELEALRRIERVFKPHSTARQRTARRARWQDAVGRAKGWARD
jgi:glycerol kinase